MNALVNEVWTEVRAAWPENAPELRLEPLPPAWGDPALLRQVWINLLSNAAKYSSKTASPAVEVSAEDGGSTVTFHVRDNGAGFDMTLASKLFTPFQRLHSSREFQGTGVGLATAQRIVARHGGRIWAEAAEGRGATFFFSLPSKNT